MQRLLSGYRKAQPTIDRTVKGIKKRGLPDHSLDLQVWQETGAGSTVVRRVRIEIDKVNRNTDEILEKYGSDSRKIYADVYIDDKACFPWEVMAYKKEE